MAAYPSPEMLDVPASSPASLLLQGRVFFQRYSSSGTHAQNRFRSP
jgi:hypothetical protein